MQVKKVPAATGWRWVVEGFTALTRSPGVMLATGALLLFTLLMTSAFPLPVIGPIIPLILTPALGFGFVQVTREVMAGRKPSPFVLFSGLGPKAAGVRREMLVLGGVNAVATLLAVALTHLVDDGRWAGFLTGARTIEAGTEIGAETIEAAIVFFAFYAPFQAAFWFAPLFVGLHRTSGLQSVFFSTVSVWRNKGALLVYFAGWFAVALGWSLLVRLITQALTPTTASIVMIPGLLVLMVALYGSFWATYRDIVDPPVAEGITRL
ncbi:MAG: BPSS1780 family membrane protein [Burkholderiaceae bacterium]